MHIRSLRIENVKSLRKLEWKPPGPDLAGWHTILGVNGAGKSSVVRAAGLALLGEEALSFSQPWNLWIRKQPAGVDKPGTSFSEVETTDHLGWDTGLESLTDPMNPDHSLIFRASFDSQSPLHLPSLNPSPTATIKPTFQFEHSVAGILQTIPFNFGEQLGGMFSAAYGPFRRFSGGGLEFERMQSSNPRASRHSSAFDERVALSASLEWLRLLKHRSLESGQYDVIESIKRFINQPGFLPHGAQLLDVQSSGIAFRDGHGSEVDIMDLSDGFRSILSLTFDLIQHLFLSFPNTLVNPIPDAPAPGLSIFAESGSDIIVAVPGVVLIDEIDAHLHPTWQRQIGRWLTRYFPQMQFIVTTHSPFVCQASQNGTIFMLPQPGSDEEGRFLEGAERDRILYGNVLDAYSTEAFGGGQTRSPEGHQRLDRLAELNAIAFERKLSPGEESERSDLRAAIPSEPDDIQLTPKSA